MRKTAFLFLIMSSFLCAQKISTETSECLDCHIAVTPGIVSDWKSSLHSNSSLKLAINRGELERRISITDINGIIPTEVAVGCYECHSLNTDSHKDAFDHFGYTINVVVSPNDCSTCHPVETNEYGNSKKAYAHDILKKNPVYSMLVKTITSPKDFDEGEIYYHGSNEMSSGESCFACHGTVVDVEGMKTIKTDLGEIDVPNLTNWPNQGVGRINPDGSFGACTSCHPRHSFSIETARKPYTCAQCHLEPDVPAYNVYKESKHGNIFSSKHMDMNFSNVPWNMSKDITAPTCATCHNSLLVDNDENIIAERTHDFGSRLWVRIFGLIYSHPQPKSPRTYEIKNSDGLPLPTNFVNVQATEFLIDKTEQSARKEKMFNVCRSCHGSNWTEKQLKKIDEVNSMADQMVFTATKMMQQAWEKGIADPSNPFDENIEFYWQHQWLFYANSIRYATAMMGPDYAGFKNGWFQASHNLQKMKNLLNAKK
ncbi:MAG: hypothetical protein JW995_11240 [Melioribacteraceae bacterium]|nr:hypothetical protein [Melioribacteraceae bacterium]